jgi:Flp pilus assembly protein CpaB
VSTRSIFLLALALGLGLFTSTVVYLQLTYTHAPPPVDMAPVVIAKRDLPARARTTAEDFTTRDYPRDALPPQAITKIADAIDRTARVEIHAGDPILAVLLAEPDQDIAGELIPEGMRAFAIRVIDSSTIVEGLIRPGSKVDVCVSMRSQDQEDRDEDGGGIARLMLQDIEILAVGKQVELGKDNKSASDRARSVTVIVKPEEANELALAQNHGALYLTLRGKGSEKVAIGRADLRQLRGDLPRPSPRTLGPVTNVVPQPVAVAPVVAPPVPAALFKNVEIDLIHGDRRSTSRLAFPVVEPVVESSDKRLD